jgi:rhodanese-related sulfurtransferase
MARRRTERDGDAVAAGTPTLDAATLARWLTDGREVQLVDIRDGATYEQGRLPGARHCPRERLEHAALALDQGVATVVY